MTQPYTFRGIELPEHLRDSIDLYVSDGVPVGSFLTACLENDLAGAIKHASDASMAAIPVVVCYLYNDCPSPCWGSREKVAAWRKERDSAKADGTQAMPQC